MLHDITHLVFDPILLLVNKLKVIMEFSLMLLKVNLIREFLMTSFAFVSIINVNFSQLIVCEIMADSFA